jgi:hypothetical protein
MISSTAPFAFSTSWPPLMLTLAAVRDWLAGTVGKAILGTAFYIGAISTILKAMDRGHLLLPALVATAALAALFACTWVVSNPRDHSQLVIDDTPPPLFTGRARIAAAVAIPLIGVAGMAGVCATKSAPPIAAARDLLDRLHAKRVAMRENEGNALVVYERYAEARRKGGRLFWEDPFVAPQAQTKNVVSHNRLLAAAVDEPLVPAALAPTSGAADLSWVPRRLQDDLNLVVARCRSADDERQKIIELQTRDVTDFENARELNERLCRYWELILGAPQTYLTTGGANYAVAERRVVRSLPYMEKEGASCFRAWF